MYSKYYLFQTKEKLIKIYSNPDEPPLAMIERYHIDDDVKYLGIYDAKTNKFLTKEIAIEEIE